MSFNEASAILRAKEDLAGRLKIKPDDVHDGSVTEKEFPDASLGAPVDDEMSAQMISDGWQIILKADGKDFEYRADKNQIRLVGFNGTNYIIES